MTNYRYKHRTFHNYVGDPVRNGDVVLSVDWEKLINELGKKAAFNRTGKTRALKGAIVVRFHPAKEGK